jgi:hypothetical protein
MKNLSYVLVILLVACSPRKQNSSAEHGVAMSQGTVPLILPPSLENRRSEFVRNLDSARANIRAFAKKNRWEDFAEEEFVDTVRIFDEKSVFNKTLLKLAGADTLMELPDTYCAALERRNLLAMSPEFYAKVYPEGIETQSYVKLLTHEIAHRLHVRILKGDEEAMGPIWFYEGFALFVANQFSESTITLTADEMKRIMMEPERGSYQKYSYVFRFFAARVPLGELVASARESNFNERLIEMLK